jgi:DNA-binding NtrC family response regulator
LLKRPRADAVEGDDGPPPRRILVAGAEESVCEVYAGVLAAFDFETATTPLGDVVSELRETLYGCAVLVGTTGSESTALKQLDAIRHSDHTHVRRTAVVLLASNNNRRMFAWESGIDGFVVMPADVADIATAIDEVLARPRLERYNHRQAMLEAARDS